MLAKDYIAQADPDKGKFRSFLLAGLKRLLCDERDKAGRLKRGGGQTIISLDSHAAEDRYRLEPADERTPEQLYECSWAAALLERAARRLQEEYVAAGKAGLFEQLTEFRLDAAEPRAYAEVAARLGLSESAVKSAIHRLRQRHHELVREEIAQTLANPAELEEEVRHLLRVIGG
ncbi:MAG: sigma factor-like helix-turn-helix DNA-binding protein [Verrucomicrobiota bacterium]